MTAQYQDDLIFDDHSADVFLTSTHAELPLQELLRRAVAERLTGCLDLQPTGLVLHLRDGALDAVEGHEPLGQILLRQGTLREEEVVDALSHHSLLGQTLLQTWKISPDTLQAALRLQAHLGLAFALAHPPERYSLKPARLLPEPTAGITGADLLQALVLREALPVDTVFCLGQTAAAVTLSPEQWRLLRWVNGRRTLARAMEASGLEPELAQQTARQLISSGLMQHSAVVGLRLIVVRLKPASSLYQPPSSIRANLFMRHLDGVRDVWTIAETLKFPTEEAATLLVALHRDHVVEVKNCPNHCKRNAHVLADHASSGAASVESWPGTPASLWFQAVPRHLWRVGDTSRAKPAFARRPNGGARRETSCADPPPSTRSGKSRLACRHQG